MPQRYCKALLFGKPIFYTDDLRKASICSFVKPVALVVNALYTVLSILLSPLICPKLRTTEKHLCSAELNSTVALQNTKVQFSTSARLAQMQC
jgi:hypothetical protein